MMERREREREIETDRKISEEQKKKKRATDFFFAII